MDADAELKHARLREAVAYANEAIIDGTLSTETSSLGTLAPRTDVVFRDRELCTLCQACTATELPCCGCPQPLFCGACFAGFARIKDPQDLEDLQDDGNHSS